MKEYVIRPIPLSEAPRDKAHWTYRVGYGQPSSMCSYVWYIEGSEPKVLVDVGCTLEAFLSRGSNQTEIKSLEDGLAKLGLKPEDIDIVIMTHLHFDHVEYAYKFTNARFFVQKKELDYALNPHQLFRGVYKPWMFKDLNFEVIDGDKEIMDGIRVMLTPGHSPGGQSVAINTHQGIAIITGFCCIMANFEPPPELVAEGYEVMASGSHTNAEHAYDSALRVKKEADIIVAVHDVAFEDRDSIP